MKKLLPVPLTSATLLVVWLMLNNTLHPAHWVLGAVLAITIPLLCARLYGEPPRVKRPMTVVRLGLTVLWDIVKSNIQVALLILGPESRIKPRFVWVPLDLRQSHAITTLAGIITMTPGTLSADLSDDQRYLLVHCFNVDDEAALIADIKLRYEAPLKEIFE